MIKCWEPENAKVISGKLPEYHPCADAVLIQGEYYCPINGYIEGYVMRCANVRPVDHFQELSFDGVGACHE